MAGTQPEQLSKKSQSVGDWVAALLALIAVVGILLALVSALFESAP